MDYLVIIEKGKTGFGAYLPDLPGCVAAGDSIEEVRELIREAIQLHLDDIRGQGLSIPISTSSAELIRVA